MRVGIARNLSWNFCVVYYRVSEAFLKQWRRGDHKDSGKHHYRFKWSESEGARIECWRNHHLLPDSVVDLYIKIFEWGHGGNPNSNVLRHTKAPFNRHSYHGFWELAGRVMQAAEHVALHLNVSPQRTSRELTNIKGSCSSNILHTQNINS
jgi:hypothetical protein